MTMSTPLTPGARQRMADVCAIYRIHDADDRLLYVGMTGDLRNRFWRHANQRWFLLAATIRVEWFATEAAAREAERQAIRTEHPQRNIQDRMAPEPSLRPIPAPPGHVTLREAVDEGIVSRTLGSLKMARWRDPAFPKPKGKSRQAALYDPDELAAYDMARG